MTIHFPHAKTNSAFERVKQRLHPRSIAEGLAFAFERAPVAFVFGAMTDDRNYHDEREAQVSAFFARNGIETCTPSLFVRVAAMLTATRVSRQAGAAPSRPAPAAPAAAQHDVQPRADEAAAPAEAPLATEAALVVGATLPVQPLPLVEPDDVPLDPAADLPVPPQAGPEQPLVMLDDQEEEFGVLVEAPSPPAPEVAVVPEAPPPPPALPKAKRPAAQSRGRRALRLSGRAVLLAGGAVLLGNLSEPVLAAILSGGTTVHDDLARDTGLMIEGTGSRPIFARAPGVAYDQPNRAHLPAEDRASLAYAVATRGLILREDKRAAAAPFSLDGFLRIHGTDLYGVGRAVIGRLAGSTKEGASTLVHQACSVSLGTVAMSGGLVANLRDKGREAACAVVLEAETRGDATIQAGMVLENATMVVGGPGSQFGAEVQGVQLASRVLFGRPFARLAACEAMFLGAATNLPFHVPGPSAQSRENTRVRQAKTTDRTRAMLELVRGESGQGLSAADRACLTTLPDMLDRRFSNPGAELYRSFGIASGQVQAEAFALRAAQPGLAAVRAGFDPSANFAAMLQVEAALCEIEGRTKLLRSICATSRDPAKVQIRFHAVTRDGLVNRSVALGTGAAKSLSEPNDGRRPSVGSVLKGIPLPLLSATGFCRYDFAFLVDVDGVRGQSYPCKPGQALPGSVAVGRSLNQPILWNLDHADQRRLAGLLRVLELPGADNHRDLVLGKRAPATQVLLRAYSAITDPGRTASLPHFIVGSPSRPIDLRRWITQTEVAKAREWLRAPTQPGGTARGMTAVLSRAGYTVIWAKTGTSEAGSGTDERGKHLVAEIVDPAGRVFIIYVEVASSDSGALSHSHALGTGDLAEITLAALEA